MEDIEALLPWNVRENIQGPLNYALTFKLFLSDNMLQNHITIKRKIWVLS
jgi:hypothetical protein